MGRPPKYKDEYCELLIQHMSSGRAFESFGSLVQCDRAVVRRWLKRHPEFDAAYKKAKAHYLMWWEKVGVLGMLGVSQISIDGKPIAVKNFNAAIWIFNMKNRFQWTDRQRLTQKVIEQPINQEQKKELIQGMAEELTSLIKESMEAPQCPSEAIGLLPMPRLPQ